MTRPTLPPLLLVALSAAPLLGAVAPPWDQARDGPRPMPVGGTAPPPVAVEACDPLAAEYRQFGRHTLYVHFYAKLATDHYRWVNDQLCWEDDRPWFADYARVALRNQDAWVALSLAMDPDYATWLREDKLAYLHEIIGDDDFAAGIMPSPFPGIPENEP